MLADYVAVVEKWNKTFNLVSRADIGRLAQRHVLDSLTGLTLLRGARILDVGSGAGLPGLVLAIADPAREFTLCDRTSRRCRFLTQAARNLGLHNVTVVESDLAPGGGLPGVEARFDTVVARAVRPAAQMWRLVSGVRAEDGILLVYESIQRDGEPGAADAKDAASAGKAETASRTGDNAGPAPVDALEFADDVRLTRHDFAIPGLAQVHTILEVAPQ